MTSIQDYHGAHASTKLIRLLNCTYSKIIESKQKQFVYLDDYLAFVKCTYDFYAFTCDFYVLMTKRQNTPSKLPKG